MGFKATNIDKGLSGAEDKMKVAKTQGTQFHTTIVECNNYWQLYKANETDSASLEENAKQFSVDAKQLTTEMVPKFAEAFAIIGGGSLSDDADINSPRLTVRDLCEQIVASAIANGLMAPEE